MLNSITLKYGQVYLIPGTGYVNIQSIPNLIVFEGFGLTLSPLQISTRLNLLKSYAEQLNIIFVLVTTSQTAINKFDSCPENILIPNPAKDGLELMMLTDYRSRKWLSNFTLGDLYGEYEIPSLPYDERFVK